MNHDLLAPTPVVVPLLVALATLLTRRHPRAQAALSYGGAVVLLLFAGLLVAEASGGRVVAASLGGWPAPFGIGFAIDGLGAALVAIAALLFVATLLFVSSEARSEPQSPLLLPLLHGLLAGVGGAFCTADLFNLYVWFEVMLVAALGLLAAGGRAAQLDGAYKYLVLNLLGTVLLVLGIALVYGVTGHLHFGAVAAARATLPAPLAHALYPVLLVAFLVKAGAFPLFAWLPASYPTLPSPVLALFAGLLTKVGVYAVLRTVGDVLAPTPPEILEGLGWVAVATMVAGVLGAAHHFDVRRILAFHIVSQVGYILLAVSLGTRAGYAAALFYTVHHIAVKANLFVLGAVAYRATGSFDVRRMGGLYAARPWLSVLFLVPALSLVGVPPLSGFFAKVLVLRETLAQGRVVFTVAALAVSVLTLYSMLKVWMEAFWKAHPDPAWSPGRAPVGGALAAALLLAAVTLFLGLCPEVFLSYARTATAALR